MGSLGFVVTPPELARKLAQILGRSWVGVLDPACGEGDLLLAAWEASGRDAAVARGLRGLEIDPERARRAKERLRATIGGPMGRAAAQGVRCADALLEPDWPSGTAIVANPPWVSLSGRQRGRIDPDRERAYREACPAMARWPSLHSAFLDRIARHVTAEGSCASVLVPASMADRDGYAGLREAVTRVATVRCEHLVPQGAIPTVTESAVVLGIRPGASAGEWTWKGDGEPPPDVSPVAVAIQHLPRLPRQCFGDVGVHTGNAGRVLVRRRGSAPADAPRILGPASVHPMREGRDLQAFELGPAGASLLIPDAPQPGLRYRIPTLARHRTVPVLIRQTADRPIAARHDAPTYFRNSLLACTPPAGLATESVLCILNSQVAADWHRARFADARQKAFPQVKVRHLRDLPFPWVDRADAPSAHDDLAGLGREIEARTGAARRALLVEMEEAVRSAYGVG